MVNQSRSLHQRLAWADSIFALGMALASVIYGNSARIPPGELHRFLQMRITVLNAIFAGLFMLAWNYTFTALDLYRTESYGALRKLMRIGEGCVLITSLLIAYLYASHTKGPSFRIGVIFFAGTFCYEIGRVLFTTWIASRDPQLVIILGSGRRAGKAWRQIRTQYHSSVKLLGFVDDRPVAEMGPDIADRYLGTIDELSALLLRNVVDELLIALPMKSCYDDAQRAVAIAEKVGVQIVYMQDMYVTTLKQTASWDHDLFTELVPTHEHYVTRQAIKRVIDAVGAFVGLCLLSPLFLLIAAAIKTTSKGPVFFVQPRYGYRRRLFRMYKFRSMVENASELMLSLIHI